MAPLLPVPGPLRACPGVADLLSPSPCGPASSASEAPRLAAAAAASPSPSPARGHEPVEDSASDIAILRQYIDLFERTNSLSLPADKPPTFAFLLADGSCLVPPADARGAVGLLSGAGLAGSGSEGSAKETGAQGDGAGAARGARVPVPGGAGPDASRALQDTLRFRLRSTLQLLLLLRQSEVLGSRLHRFLCAQRAAKQRRRASGGETHEGETDASTEAKDFESAAVAEAASGWAATSELSEGQALRWIFARYRSVQVLVALEAWLQWEARYQAAARGPAAAAPLESCLRSGSAQTGFRDSAERHLQAAEIGAALQEKGSRPPAHLRRPSAFYHADWPYVLPLSPSSPAGALGSCAPPLVSARDEAETREFFAAVWSLLRMGLPLEAEKLAVERGAAWLIEVIRGDESWMEPYVADDVDMSVRIADVFTDQELRLLSDASPILKACMWSSGYSLQHVALAARAGEDSRAALLRAEGAEGEAARERDDDSSLSPPTSFKDAGLASALEKQQLGWYGEGKKGRSLLIHVCQKILAKQQESAASSSCAFPASPASEPASGLEGAAGKGAVGVAGGLGVGESLALRAKGGFVMEGFEQAIYGYLSGSLEAMESVCGGWGDCLFALVRAIKASLIDGTLRCLRSHEPHGRFAGEPRHGGFLPPSTFRKGRLSTFSAFSAPCTARTSAARSEGRLSSLSPRKKRRTGDDLLAASLSLSPDLFSASCDVSRQASPLSAGPGRASAGGKAAGGAATAEGESTRRRKRKSLRDPLRALLTEFLTPQGAQSSDPLLESRGGAEHKSGEGGRGPSGYGLPDCAEGRVCCCGRAWSEEEAREGAAKGVAHADCLQQLRADGRVAGEDSEGDRELEVDMEEAPDDDAFALCGEEKCARQVDEGVLTLLFNIMNDLPLFLRRFVPSAHSRSQVVTEGADELRLLQLFLVFHFLQHSPRPHEAPILSSPGLADAGEDEEEKSLYVQCIRKLLRKTFGQGIRLVLPRAADEKQGGDCVTVSCQPSLPFQEFVAFFVVLQADLRRPFLAFPSARDSLEAPLLTQGLTVKDVSALVGGFVSQLFQQLEVADVLRQAKIVELLRYVSTGCRIKLLSDWLWQRFAARAWESPDGRERLGACVAWTASHFPQEVLRVALRCAERSWRSAGPRVLAGPAFGRDCGRDSWSEAVRVEREEEDSGAEEEASFKDRLEDEESGADEARLALDDSRAEGARERLQFSVFLLLSVFSLFYLDAHFERQASEPLKPLLRNPHDSSSLLAPLSSATSSNPSSISRTRPLLLLGLYCLSVICHLGLLGLCLDFRSLLRLARNLLRAPDAGVGGSETPGRAELSAPAASSAASGDESNGETVEQREKEARRKSRRVAGVGDWVRFAVEPGLVSPLLDLLIHELEEHGASDDAGEKSSNKRQEGAEDRPRGSEAREEDTTRLRAGSARDAALSAEKENLEKAPEVDQQDSLDGRSRPSTVSFVSCDEPAVASSRASSLLPSVDPIERMRSALVGGAPVLRLRDSALMPTAPLLQFHDLLNAASLHCALNRRFGALSAAADGSPERRASRLAAAGLGRSEDSSPSVLQAAARLFGTSALVSQAFSASSLAHVSSSSPAAAPAGAGDVSASFAFSAEGCKRFFPLLADRRGAEEAAAQGAVELEARLQFEQLSRRISVLRDQADEARLLSVAEKAGRVRARVGMLANLEAERQQLQRHAAVASLFNVPVFLEAAQDAEETLESALAFSSCRRSPCAREGRGCGEPGAAGARGGGEEDAASRESRGPCAERWRAAAREEKKAERRARETRVLLLLREELLGQAQQLVLLADRLLKREGADAQFNEELASETGRERRVAGASEQAGGEETGAADEGGLQGNEERREQLSNSAGVAVFASEVLSTAASLPQRAEAMLEAALSLGDFPVSN